MSASQPTVRHERPARVRVHHNLSVPALYEHALRRDEGVIAAGGPLVVRTGVHTGRSPLDKFVVDEPASRDQIWWGEVNRPISEDHYEALREKVIGHLAKRETFVKDAYVGWHPAHRRSVRVTTESAWASLFAHNLFIRPSPPELAAFRPDFTIYDAPSLQADPARDGTRSGTFILVHVTRREVLIGGTAYAGEIKKSAFTVMNYLMPHEGVLPMHSSVNVGPAGDTAVFFGLSGTGKTTLVADPTRTLIGDDEHGWGPDGVFNFEGGCYAKTIRLSPIYEPDIFSTTKRFGTILENVVMDPLTRELDLESEEVTENTRGAFPVTFISNAVEPGIAGHPRTLIFLTADAFGVLPHISRLTREQAMYHFISGYTAKLAGTEVGVKEPSATFSACFGAPFMPRHPSVYAHMLGDRMAQHDVPVWLINTGWTGGPYGVGQRVNIHHTRAMVHAAIEHKLEGTELIIDPIFRVAVPAAVPDVPAEILHPRNTWADSGAYDAQARTVAALFEANIARYRDGLAPEVLEAGPHAG
ncbi:MAG: phosphoenolpyruvate carboxykinase (ATP), partial [Candidatus Limnocylindrales bacterium]